MVIDPGLLNLISLLITVGGSVYGARLLYRQIIGKNTSDATKSLNDTIIDQNDLIQKLQDRNQTQADLLASYQSKERYCNASRDYIVGRYKVYAPLEVQTAELEQMSRLLRGDSGPLNKITKPS